MALADADPDAAQHTVIEPILSGLEPTLRDLRAAEPVDLDGVVDTWVTEMHGFATGNFPVEPAEAARGRMDKWVEAHCRAPRGRPPTSEARLGPEP